MPNVDKLTYSIGQAAEYANIAQSTLRYWETVIDAFKPQKSPGGTRRYTKGDLELIILIKELLYIKGHTIKGANIFLRNKDLENSVSESVSKSDSITEEHPVEKNDAKPKMDRDGITFIYKELKFIKQILE
jgi:DNA-binding transcriptional MerR regulator